MTEPHSDQKPLSLYQKIIASIVDGHAFGKHVFDEKAFPGIETKKQFAKYIGGF